MEENKRKKAPNLVLAIICVTLIIFFAVLFTVCVINYNQAGNKPAAQDEKTTVTNKAVENTVAEDEEEVNEVTDEVVDVEDEEAQVKALIDKFVKAVNEKDWDEVEKLSSKSIVDEIKKYEMSNFSVKTDRLEKNPNKENGYMATSHYDFSYQGMSAKDLSLGNIFSVEKINGEYVVTEISATGP